MRAKAGARSIEFGFILEPNTLKIYNQDFLNLHDDSKIKQLIFKSAKPNVMLILSCWKALDKQPSVITI